MKRNRLFCVVVGLAVALSSVVCVSAADIPADQSFSLLADSYVDSGNSTYNYGGASTAIAKSYLGSRYAYFKVDLSEIRPHIADFDLASVTVEWTLRDKSGSEECYVWDLYRVEDDSWVEGSASGAAQDGAITYDVRPEISDTAIGEMTVTQSMANGDKISADITEAVAKELRKSETDNMLSFSLKERTNANTALTLYQKEYGGSSVPVVKVRYKAKEIKVFAPKQTFVAAADVWVNPSSNRAGSNYGGEKYITIKTDKTKTGGRSGYYKFDLEGIRENLALDCEIESAFVKIYLICGNSSNPVRDKTVTTDAMSVRLFYLEDDSWTEGKNEGGAAIPEDSTDVTFNKQPKERADDAPCSDAVTIPAGSGQGTIASAEYQPLEAKFDVTKMLKAEVAKQGDNTLSMQLGFENYQGQIVNFYSKENADAITYGWKPVIEVNYRSPLQPDLYLQTDFTWGELIRSAGIAVPNGAEAESVHVSDDITDMVKAELAKAEDETLSLLLRSDVQSDTTKALMLGQTTNAALAPRLLVTFDDGAEPMELLAAEGSYVQGGSSANTAKNGGAELKAGNPRDNGARWYYSKYDISALKEKIDNLQSVKLQIAVRAGNTAASDFDIGVYYIENDSWSMSTITMNNCPKFSASESIDALKAGQVIANLSVINAFAEDKNVTILWALYSPESRLISIEATPLTLTAGDVQDLIREFTIPQDGKYMLRIYCFDSLYTIKPCKKPIEI